MSISRDEIEKIIFQEESGLRRYTQDSPIYPDVWLEYHNADPHTYRVDLLLTPRRGFTASKLLVLLRQRLQGMKPAFMGLAYEGQEDMDPETIESDEISPWRLANSGNSVVARLTFRELIVAVLPMTKWWQNYLWDKERKPTKDLEWLQKLTVAITLQDDDIFEIFPFARSKGRLEREFNNIIKGMPDDRNLPACLWSVSLNREATCSIKDSVATTKANATRRLFDIDGSGITWAVLDTGIDARHEAFRKIDTTGEPYNEALEGGNNRRLNNTRIKATYDFTILRSLMDNIGSPANNLLDILLTTTSDDEDHKLTRTTIKKFVSDLKRALKNGRMLDWSIIGPLLRVPHNEDDYIPPLHPHGTHVAGIIGADMSPWKNKSIDKDLLVGMCPGIELYDLRVLNKEGVGDEFSILAALQFIRWLNEQNDQLVIHGVNLSLSLVHQVANYACGRTPICEECQRLVAEGTVVVAAAGNHGRAIYSTQNGASEGFRTVCITDPGNAENVITVGSTHRSKPHTYGVSYFSSRGPTGDGRLKPDLLAPGEKIKSTVIGNEFERMDGTSMAAPHVSGVAALLLSKHREMIGQPIRIKQVLCESATDLGREKYFQGHGMIDALRALQSL